MGKKKHDPDEEVSTGAPESAPVGAPPSGSKPGVGPTGYDYSGWGSVHSLGSRPPAKTDWDAMTPEQRAAIGLPEWKDYKAAAQAWRANFKPGGGNYEFQQSLARDIANSGANSWDQIERVLAQRGIFNRKEEGQALFRRLQGAFQGTMDPSGRFHRTPDGQWVDVGTSDLAKRGIPGAADFHGSAPSGLQGVLGGLAMQGGKSDIQQFQDFLASGSSSIEGTDPRTGLYYNDTPDGRRVYYDRAGYQVDPQSGQTLGHYVSGAFQQPQGQPQGGDFGGGAPGEVSFAGGGRSPFSTPNTGVRGPFSGARSLGGPATGGAFSLSSLTGGGPGAQASSGGGGGFLGSVLDQVRNPPPGEHTIFEEPPRYPWMGGSMQGGGSGSFGPGGGSGGFTPGDHPFEMPELPPPQGGGPVGSYSDPALRGFLMGQAGLDFGSQDFMLDRAQQEYAGAQPIEALLTGLYGDVLGAGGAAGDRRTFGLLAPEVNRMMGDTDALLERFKQEAPIGGERSKGIADILNQAQGNMLGLRQGLQQQAIGGLTDIMNQKKGFNPGPYSGTGLGMLGDLTSRRGQDVSMRGQDMDFGLGIRGQDLQRMLGMMGDATQRRGQDFDFGLGQGQLQLGYAGQQTERDIAKMQQQAQKDQGRRSWWQSLLGTAGSVLGGLLSDRQAKDQYNPLYWDIIGSQGSILSDQEMKENVGDFRGSMDELRKIPVYSFRYKDDAPEMAGEKHIGVFAQEVQKVAPDAVTKGEDGYLRIKPMALLSMTMNAVKNLDSRLTALTKKREK